MIRAIIDTNVLVSGIFWSGTPARILEAWGNGRFSMVISPEILLEYTRVIGELAAKKPIDTKAIIDRITLGSEMVAAPRFKKQACEDPDDDRFLECAVAGKVPYIASGDKLLLKLHPFGNIQILKPAAFLAALEKK